MVARRYPKWSLAAFSIVLGGICLAAFWIGGHPGQGWFSFALIAGLGLASLVFGRSELVRGLRGDGRDEYWASLDRDASLFAGMFLILLVIAMCCWEWAHGRDGMPYARLGAATGVAYIFALAGMRLRR
jgi:hypothetical protein